MKLYPLCYISQDRKFWSTGLTLLSYYIFFKYDPISLSFNIVKVLSRSATFTTLLPVSKFGECLWLVYDRTKAMRYNWCTLWERATDVVRRRISCYGSLRGKILHEKICHGTPTQCLLFFTGAAATTAKYDCCWNALILSSRFFVSLYFVLISFILCLFFCTSSEGKHVRSSETKRATWDSTGSGHHARVDSSSRRSAIMNVTRACTISYYCRQTGPLLCYTETRDILAPILFLVSEQLTISTCPWVNGNPEPRQTAKQQLTLVTSYEIDFQDKNPRGQLTLSLILWKYHVYINSRN